MGMRFEKRLLSMAAVLGLPWLLQGPVQAEVLLKVQRIGADVVVSGSGTANILDLTSVGDSNIWTNVMTDVQIYAGPDAFNDGEVGLFSGLSGPLVLGSDPMVTEYPVSTGSSGDLFGILADTGSSVSQLVLPKGYVSGSSLSGTTTFAGRSLAELGLTPGQVTTWTWGSGVFADSLRLEVLQSTTAVPTPAPFLAAVAAFRSSRRL